MQFYLYLNGVRRGPFSEERVQALLTDGVLLPTDLAVEESGGEWRMLSSFLRFTTRAQSLDSTAPAVAAPVVPPINDAPEQAAVAVAEPKGLSAAPAGESELPKIGADSLGRYARATLGPNETPFYRTSLHWIVFARFAILALLVFLFVAMPLAIGIQILTGSQIGWFALPLPAFIMLPPTLAFASSELVITDQRVLIKTGIITRQTLEMFIPRIESVAVHQALLGRMLDFGTVTIRGMGGSEEAFEAIAHPLEFRNSVQRLQSGGAGSTAPISRS
ncbi:MAG: PH domain-containing protein [Chthoniobacterales bacterium]